MRPVPERFDKLVMHRGDRRCELTPHIIGFAASFGNVTFDPPLQANIFGYVDVDSEVESFGDLLETQQQDPFHDHHRAGFDDDDLFGSGVGVEVVDRHRDVTPGTQRFDIGHEPVVIQRVGMVVVDNPALFHRQMALIAVIRIEGDDRNLFGSEMVKDVSGQRGLASS